MMEKYFVIHDRKGRRHTVHLTEEGVRFPSYGNRFSHELKGLVDAEEGPLDGPLAVVALVEHMDKEAHVLGPDWVELWTALGWHDQVQQSLRVTYRSLRALVPTLNEGHQELARLQMKDLRNKMTEESISLMNWEERND